MSDLAAVGAFVAAGISLVNVGITARLSSRGQREQWRRDEERPIVARCLALSEEASSEWRVASAAKEDGDTDEPGWMSYWLKGKALLRDLRFEVRQLDLLASSAVREAARGLVAAHEHESTRLEEIILGEDDSEGRQFVETEMVKLRDALSEGARTDLGLGVAKPSKSLLGMLLTAINGS